jgi:hypothetical protein
MQWRPSEQRVAAIEFPVLVRRWEGLQRPEWEGSRWRLRCNCRGGVRPLHRGSSWVGEAGGGIGLLLGRGFLPALDGNYVTIHVEGALAKEGSGEQAVWVFKGDRCGGDSTICIAGRVSNP